MAKNFKRFGAIVASGAAVAAAVSSPVAAVAQERVAEEAALDTPIGDTGVTPREVYETIVYAAENDPELRAQILEVEAQIMGSHVVESENGEYYINEAALDLGAITGALGNLDVGAITNTLGNVANKVGGAVSNGDFAGAVGAITGAMNDPNIKKATDAATKIGKDLVADGTAGKILGGVTGTVGSLLGKDKDSAGATTDQKPAGTTGTNTTGTGSGSTGGSATPGTGSTGGSATPNTGSTDTKPSTNKPAPTTSAKPADNKPKPSTSKPAPKTTENKPAEDKATDSKPAPKTTENKTDSTDGKKSGEKATATSEKKTEEKKAELANTERARTSVAEGKDIVSLLKDYDYSNVNAEQGDKLRKIGKRIADEVVRVEAALRGTSQDALDASVKALNDSISEYNKTVSAITAEQSQSGDEKGASSDKKDSTVVVDNREGTSEEKRVVVKEGESETTVETSSRPMLASTGAPVGAVAAAAAGLVAMTGFAASRRNK